MFRQRVYVYLIAVVFVLAFSSLSQAQGFIDPVAGEMFHYLSQSYSNSHKALDITGFSREAAYTIKGRPVVATKDGKVIYADWEKYKYKTDPKTGKSTITNDPDTKAGCGKMVIIDHGDGTVTQSCHLNDFNKEDGTPLTAGTPDKPVTVNQGARIGSVDNTGHSSGNHLHFVIRNCGAPFTGSTSAEAKNYFYNKCTPVNPEPLLPGPYCTRLDKNCREPIPTYCPLCYGPGGGHPDDTFSVADAIFPDVPVDLTDAYYRLAVKHGKAVVINYFVFKTLIQERDAYLEGLADGVAPDQAYLDAVGGRINLLYESFGVDQRLLWDEIASLADVAVLDNGFYDADVKFLNRLREPAFETNANFNPADVVKDHPVLLIPSGGLYGLENSSFFKASLDEYVKQGGALIVFAQQRGYEFGVLPVPQEADGSFKPITGYGWEEDQNCFTDAVYIETWSQFLSGQSRGTPTLNVDGYFTSYPSNSTVILRRTANGQPAMLMYEHGLGRVVVTTMYSDWAYGHSQASLEEIALVRDLISWAKKPAVLPLFTEHRTGKWML